MTTRAMHLHAYLATNYGRPFQPGLFDGALFAAGWIEVLTGKNPAAAFAGRYASVAQGLRLVRRETGCTLRDLVARNATPVGHWMRASPGDLAVIGAGNRACIGIVGGAHVHVVSARCGLDFISLSDKAEVFRP